MKNVCELSCDFGKSRIAVTARSSAERVRGNVQALHVFALGLDLLQYADIFAQILQVLRGFLKEQFYGFAVWSAHARPSATSSGFKSSSAVGLRYKMQSFKTIAWNLTGIFEIDSEWPRNR